MFGILVEYTYLCIMGGTLKEVLDLLNSMKLSYNGVAIQYLALDNQMMLEVELHFMYRVPLSEDIIKKKWSYSTRDFHREFELYQQGAVMQFKDEIDQYYLREGWADSADVFEEIEI